MSEGDYRGELLTLQSVLAGLSLARVPVRHAINELAEALCEPEALSDLPGVLRAWRRLCVGAVTPATRAGWPVSPGGEAPSVDFDATAPIAQREAVALALAAREGRVTSKALAEATGTSQEAARVDLTVLAARGALEPRGMCRGRYYTSIAGQNDT